MGVGPRTGRICMLKIFAAAVSIVAMTALPASADLSQKFGRASSKKMKIASSHLLPPADYKGQWWTSPDNCEYSRAGRPGETVWYLIINTAHSKCKTHLVQSIYKDAY